MTTVSPASAPAGAPRPVAAAPHGGDDTREVELSVEGMTCAACAVRVEKKLGKLDGVHAMVNYATATALVTAPAGLPVRALTAAVEQAGYTAAARDEQYSADEVGAADEHGAAIPALRSPATRRCLTTRSARPSTRRAATRSAGSRPGRNRGY